MQAIHERSGLPFDPSKCNNLRNLAFTCADTAMGLTPGDPEDALAVLETLPATLVNQGIAQAEDFLAECERQAEDEQIRLQLQENDEAFFAAMLANPNLGIAAA